MSWIGFDFDGTLSSLIDGSPIEPIIQKVKEFRQIGLEVRICTARVAAKYGEAHVKAHTDHIQRWCLLHLGEILPVTAEKDYDMVLLYDDRAVAVKTNEGLLKGWNDVVEVEVETPRK